MVKLDYKDNKYSITEREQFLSSLQIEKEIKGVLINTCNRVELYKGEGYVPEKVAKHLFSVASGLKSNLVGDTSIQGQIKLAYTQACGQQKLDKGIHKLFQTALFVGKKVRTQTTISKGAVSYPQAALEILLSKVGNLQGKNICILGVHNINENIVQSLAKKGVSTTFIGNRTLAKAEYLASRFNAKAFNFNHLSEYLQKTDVLITATSAPHTVIKAENFPINKKMFIIDLAVPRDVDPELKKFKNVVLVNVEDVERQVNQNLNNREDEIEKAKEIVNYEVERFMDLQTKNYGR